MPGTACDHETNAELENRPLLSRKRRRSFVSPAAQSKEYAAIAFVALGVIAFAVVTTASQRTKSSATKSSSSSSSFFSSSAFGDRVRSAYLEGSKVSNEYGSAKAERRREASLGATTYYEETVYNDPANSNPMHKRDVNEVKTSKMRVNLHTGCSPHEHLPFSVEDKSLWGEQVAAKIIFKANANDFEFAKGIDMRNVGCGTYEIETEELLVGMQFGFALYQMNNQSLHNPTKDIGCRSESDSDARCPKWKSSERELVGGPMEMKECTFQYKYGDVTFYNRVFDGETTDFVWGSCLDTCPRFTTTPYCGKDEVARFGTAKLREAEHCVAGEYLQANLKCQKCPVGHYSTHDNALECKPCASGSMQPNEGKTECMLCPHGWYQSEEGQQYCDTCPGARSQVSRRKLSGGALKAIQDNNPLKGFDWSKLGTLDSWEWIEETVANATEIVINATETSLNNTYEGVKYAAQATSDAFSGVASAATNATESVAKTAKQSAKKVEDTVNRAVADVASTDAVKVTEDALSKAEEQVASAVEAVEDEAIKVEEAVDETESKVKESVEKEKNDRDSELNNAGVTTPTTTESDSSTVPSSGGATSVSQCPAIVSEHEDDYASSRPIPDSTHDEVSSSSVDNNNNNNNNAVGDDDDDEKNELTKDHTVDSIIKIPNVPQKHHAPEIDDHTVSIDTNKLVPKKAIDPIIANDHKHVSDVDSSDSDKVADGIMAGEKLQALATANAERKKLPSAANEKSEVVAAALATKPNQQRGFHSAKNPRSWAI